MHPRCAASIVALTLGMLTFAVPSRAGKLEVQPIPLPPNAPVQELHYGRMRGTAACRLGAAGASTWIVNYLLPPDDAYYTLIQPSTCSGCEGGFVSLSRAHVFLNVQAPCSFVVSARILGARGSEACSLPDTSIELCQRTSYTLSPSQPGNYDFVLELAQLCCVNQNAFLEINFVSPGAGCSDGGTIPRLITTGSCDPCVSYNAYPVSGGHQLDDLCATVGFPGNPIMFADGGCCHATPVHRSSWGSMKTLYR